MAWVSDAQNLGKLDLSMVAKTRDIEEFLTPNSFDKHIIVSAKGMGKTLLIRHKREQVQSSKQGFFIIPQNEQSDYVNLPSSPSKEIEESLRDRIFWEDLWKISISASIILGYPLNIEDDEVEDLLSDIYRWELPYDLERMFERKLSDPSIQVDRRPSSILDSFLRAGKSGIERFRKEGMHKIWDLYLDNVQSACAVFIDSLDQELNRRHPGDLKIWCAGQAGLLKAAWELSRHNRHVKIFVTIRQEAYSWFRDPEINNIKGSILVIKYERKDLEKMFGLSIRFFDGARSIKDFLGFDELRNSYINVKENAFEYLSRHLLPVPRWYILMGEEISKIRRGRGVIKNKKEALRHEKELTDRINSFSSENLMQDYLESEMRYFFGSVEPLEMIRSIFRNAQSTVLSWANILRLTERYREEFPLGISDPFSLMANLGLVGAVEPVPKGTGFHQRFKRPFEFNWDYDQTLPSSPETHFLLHPAIHHIAQLANHNFRYSRVKIGDRLPWTSKNIQTLEKNKISIFVSYASIDWDSVVSKVVNTMERRFNEKGVQCDIWVDKYKMRSGGYFLDQMQEGVKRSRFLVLMVSKNSLESKAVSAEWKNKYVQMFGGENGDRIFPFIVDDTEYKTMPDFISLIHTYRFDDDEGQISLLVDDIEFWNSELT